METVQVCFIVKVVTDESNACITFTNFYFFVPRFLLCLFYCSGFYHCLHGALQSGVTMCAPGLLFDSTILACNYAGLVSCTAITRPPTPRPTPVSSGMVTTKRPTYLRLPPTSQPTPLPTLHPTQRPTSHPTQQPTRFPTLLPTEQPTKIPPCGSWCPEKSWAMLPSEGCKGFYSCVGGVKISGITHCAAGMLFDRLIMGCNWAELVTCDCPDTEPEPQASIQTSRPTLKPTKKSEIWYPDWTVTNSCSNDGLQPGWMSGSYFSSTRSDCCRSWFWYDAFCDRD